MYRVLSLLTGAVIAIMIAINGVLTNSYGTLNATFIIHIVGTVFAFIVAVGMKEKIRFPRDIPKWLYTGGAVGLLTTVFNNFAFGKINMSSIIAIGLFGQMMTSLITDRFGLFGMKRHNFSVFSLFGCICALIGMYFMLDGSDSMQVFAIVFSFLAGVTVVVSRSINARLSEYTSALQSSFINHLVGLGFTAILVLFISGKTVFMRNMEMPFHIWMYLGGTLGVATVLLSNITVPKVSAFQLTLLTFVGQLFTGLLIDFMTKSPYTRSSIIGGVLISIGIIINIFGDRAAQVKIKP